MQVLPGIPFRRVAAFGMKITSSPRVPFPFNPETTMNDSINKQTVLLLNKNWQPIATKTPAQAFGMMAADAATALDTETMTPVKWEDWIGLPVHGDTPYAQTAHRKIRLPTVVVCLAYNKMPMHRPRLSNRNIHRRDGYVCQYTGRKLKPSEADVDHVTPRARGGRDTWDNLVTCDMQINRTKADKTAEEAGLKLLRKPSEPRAVPAFLRIANTYDIPEWRMFLPGA